MESGLTLAAQLCYIARGEQTLAQDRLFMSGRSQHVTLPAELRFAAGEVCVRRDPESGDLILSPATADWKEVFAALDAARFPDHFMADREQGAAERREPL